MASFRCSRCLVALSISTLLSLTSEAAPMFPFGSCSNSSFFTPNSTFQTNLNDLLTALSSNATNPSGFYTAKVGQVPPDQVRGLFLCRADLTPDRCQNCISTAIIEITNFCPLDRMGIIWYYECTLHYTYESSLNPRVPSQNLSTSNQTMVETGKFNTLLISKMKSLQEKVVNSQSEKKFATAEVKFTDSQTLYCMVQCSPRLTKEDCSSCLDSAIGSLPQCCAGKQGGMVLLPSSNIRYELYL